jgi:protein-disulfide isomerase
MLKYSDMKKALAVSIVSIATLAALGAAYYAMRGEPYESRDKLTSTNQQAVDGSPEITAAADKLIIGNPGAPVTVIEYADYKCPECGQLYQKASVDIRKNYIDTGKAKIEFRPYPLFGEDSGLALYASYCAAEQGKFEAYHDKMFEYMWQNYYQNGDYSAATQELFSPEKLGLLAGEAGLDSTSFTSCAGGKTYADAYNSAIYKAAGDEVQGTPTLIIGGQKVVGPQPYGVYKTLLDIAKS